MALEVKTMFHKYIATKLIDMINQVRESNKQPYWNFDDRCEILVENWETEKAKERSKKTSKSLMSNQNGLGLYQHRAGSRSYAKVVDLLVKKTGGASYIDVLRETHQKPDGSFVDERAKQINII
ncbi:unnamed protein product [Arabidopsis halleri]